MIFRLYNASSGGVPAKTRASAGHAAISWIRRWRRAASSRCRARLQACSTACGASWAGPCSSWAARDPHLEQAFDWLARSVTGEGVASREDRRAAVHYYAGKCGPDFACEANNRLPCAWSAVKVLLGLGRWLADRRTPAMERAIAHSVALPLGTDPALAEYPNGYNAKPSGNWWRFGFPVFYVTDLLQNVEALVGLGYGRDPRLAVVFDLIRGKQDAAGRWGLEHDYAGKTWVDFGPKKRPSPWVTLRAWRVLKAVG